MWESIKKDPLIKTIAVILIGVLAFGFAFNIMFGAGGSSMEDGSMVSAGYSLGNTLENIIGLLIKLVIIGLLLGVLIWIFRTVTKQIGNGQDNRFAWIKEDSIIRNALIITGAVVVLIFALSFFKNNSSYAFSNISFSLTTLFAFLMKVLILIFIIALAYGVIMYLKENSINKGSIKTEESSDAITKDCPECKEKLNNEWKCCPYCGSDKAFNNTTV